MKTREPTLTELAAFGAAWDAHWPDVAPVGYELRYRAPETWVRFHSLPESKRYPGDRSERDEVLRRHLVLLGELGVLCGTQTTDLRVITVSGSSSTTPVPREARIARAFPSGRHWRSLPLEPDWPDDDSWWVHYFLGRCTLTSRRLRNLLRLVMVDRAEGVVIAPAGAQWLYHPYDGGADVIAPSTEVREILRERHADWLSAHPSGL